MTNVEYGILSFVIVQQQLSALIRIYGHVLAVMFFPTRALSVEWIRFICLLESIPQVLRYGVYEPMY
jgi:hypothetical protein